MRSRALTQYIRYVPIHSYSPTLQTMNSVHGLFFVMSETQSQTRANTAISKHYR